jgi:hypothetical protein
LVIKDLLHSVRSLVKLLSTFILESRLLFRMALTARLLCLRLFNLLLLHHNWDLGIKLLLRLLLDILLHRLLTNSIAILVSFGVLNWLTLLRKDVRSSYHTGFLIIVRCLLE